MYISRAPFCRRGRRRGRNSTCKIKEKEREREREREKKRERERKKKERERRKRERTLTSSETKNVRPNHAGFVFQRHARVSRRWRWADDNGTLFIVFSFRLKFFPHNKKRERTQNGKKKKRKREIQFSFWTVGRDSAFFFLFPIF